MTRATQAHAGPRFSAHDLVRLGDALPFWRASGFAASLNAVLGSAEIVTRQRLRHFAAQIAHETAGFRRLSEDLDYRSAARLRDMFPDAVDMASARTLIEGGPEVIGDTIYAGRLGNGDIASGDGYRYRGRGFLMVTGRANYAWLGPLCGVDLTARPDLLEDSACAARAAAAFWHARNVNAAADRNDIDAVTRLVAGSLEGLSDRKRRLAIAARLWP